MTQDGLVTAPPTTGPTPPWPGAPMPMGPPSRPPMLRSSSDSVVSGVSAGLARHLGIPVWIVRLAFVLGATIGGGAGLVVYIVLWAVAPSDREYLGSVPLAPVEHRQSRLTGHHWLVIVGIGLMAIGLSLGTTLGSWVADLGYLVPLLVIAVGAFVAWYRIDDPRVRAAAGRRDRLWAIAQAVVGLAVVTTGVVVLVTQGQGPRGVWNGALAAIAVLVGAAVIAAPFALRMWRGLQREQAERVRATERADIAAHLHDSVLQTLALIQRRADDPTTVQRLARSQERELRQWLYGAEQRESDSLAASLAHEVHEVEDEHGVPVELVVTGDRVIDEPGDMLVKATREAVLNAVRHGRPPVSVYVEIGPEGAEVFVRDHGDGFELEDIAEDRLGVRESILGRMTRAGGRARVRRLEHGTEVSLSVPPPDGESVGAGAGPRHTGSSETSEKETSS